MISKLLLLREWRRHVETLTQAIKNTIPEAEVYLAGGAAENRLTVLSDIDILVVLPQKPSLEEAAELRAKIWEEAERREAYHHTRP